MGLFRRSTVRSVSAESLAQAVAAGADLVDVREDGEWRPGHLEGARHIPLDELGARLGEIDPKRFTIFVCRVGARSGSAAAALADRGYDVANLDGGMIACARAGIAVVRDDGTPGLVV